MTYKKFNTTLLMYRVDLTNGELPVPVDSPVHSEFLGVAKDASELIMFNYYFS